jgi:hypothetical protein
MSLLPDWCAKTLTARELNPVELALGKMLAENPFLPDVGNYYHFERTMGFASSEVNYAKYG